MPRPSARDLALRETFEQYHSRYHRPEFLGTDPLCVVHRFPDPADREVVALLAAAFASGNIKAILAVMESILAVLGPRPARWLSTHDPASLRGAFAGIYHRWVRAEDVEVLLALIGEALRRHGTLGALWQSLDDPAATDTAETLGRFSDALLAMPVAPLVPRERTLQRGGRTTTLAPIASILLTSPGKGSACKRMHLFLRWVVRPADGIDLGLWTPFLDPARLMMPVDTHVLQVCRRLRLTRARTPNRRTVEEITARFRRINPDDPCRYDFALVRAGILGKDEG